MTIRPVLAALITWAFVFVLGHEMGFDYWMVYLPIVIIPVVYLLGMWEGFDK